MKTPERTTPLMTLALLLALSWPGLASAHEPASWSGQPDPSAQADEQEGPPEGVAVTLAGEFGFLDVLSNRLQQDSNGTYFDYVEDGGQELFVPFFRISAELLFNERHNVILLYQPLDLRTRVRLDDELIVDDRVFPEGKAMDLRFGFDFFRATYTYDLLASERSELAVGGGFQMRIASLEFVPLDGTEPRISRDLGPVPLIKLRGRHDFANGWWLGAEVDGFYANIRFLNGDPEDDVTGAILDASVRAGLELGEGLDGFLNLRYVGGGGEGTSSEDALDPGDGYSRSWIQLATVSLGFYFEPWYLVE